jgi:hypothetical protein
VVPRFQSRKTELGSRGDQIVPDVGLMPQKLITHLYTDRVLSHVFGTRIAFPVTIESCQWIRTARLQSGSQNILNHLQSVLLAIYTICIAAPSIAVTARRLRNLVGVGRCIEADLHKLGVKSVAQLAACDADHLYQELCRKTHTRQDPCVLDTFRCAVAQARDPNLPFEQRNWWWWSRQRKQQNA